MNQHHPSHPPSGVRLVGTLVRINRKKGYGFIEPDDPTHPDYFVNISSFIHRNDFREDRRVAFDPGEPKSSKIAPPAFNVTGIA